MPRLAIATGLLCTITASVASAQSIALDEFRPAIDSRGYLTLNGSQTLDHGEMSFGLGSLQWGRKLLSFESGPTTYSVDDMVSATLVAALGLRLGPVPLEVGASLPVTIVSGSRDDQGIGDFGLHLKTRLAHAGRFGLGAIGSVYIPTSSSRAPFLGEPAATPQLVAVADATFGNLRFAINGGIRLRRTSTFMAIDGGTTMGSITTSTALPAGVAVAWGVVPEKVELVGEVFGAIPIGTHHGYQALEALGGVKVYLAKSSYLSLGAGRGLVPGEAGNPDLRAVIGIVFEPKPAQRLSGTIPDAAGRTARGPPGELDDGLGDRDNDGILDKDDACPDDPENYNGVDDEDGCPEPDRPLAIETESEIVTLQPIEFEFDRAVLRPSAVPILNDVVKSLRDNPDLTLIEIQGHTDEQGNDAYNLDLSNRRAAAVMKFLVDSGIAADRLASQGYGETQPLDRRHTQEAYKLNRRVAFIIRRRG